MQFEQSALPTKMPIHFFQQTFLKPASQTLNTFASTSIILLNEERMLTYRNDRLFMRLSLPVPFLTTKV